MSAPNSHSYHVAPTGGALIVDEHDGTIAIATSWAVAAEIVQALNTHALRVETAAPSAVPQNAELVERIEALQWDADHTPHYLLIREFAAALSAQVPAEKTP